VSPPVAQRLLVRQTLGTRFLCRFIFESRRSRIRRRVKLGSILRKSSRSKDFFLHMEKGVQLWLVERLFHPLISIVYKLSKPSTLQIVLANGPPFLLATLTIGLLVKEAKTLLTISSMGLQEIAYLLADVPTFAEFLLVMDETQSGVE
jgi:hypothetical protein